MKPCPSALCTEISRLIQDLLPEEAHFVFVISVGKGTTVWGTNANRQGCIDMLDDAIESVEVEMPNDEEPRIVN